jgi:hypothetical protein
MRWCIDLDARRIQRCGGYDSIHLSLDTFQTSKLKTGYMFDLEQLVDQATPETWRTWWICTKLHVQKDVSHT